MRERITFGTSVEAIREELAGEWSCQPEELMVEVIEEPGLDSSSWKIKVLLPDRAAENSSDEGTKILWDGEKFQIYPGKIVETIVPFPPAGKLYYQGTEIVNEFNVRPGDNFQFFAEEKQGSLTWKIEVGEGKKALAKVRHEHSGKYIIKNIPQETKVIIEKYIAWEATQNSCRLHSEEELKKQLAEKGIIFGLKDNIWVKFLMVDGEDEIVLAEYDPPVPTIQPELADYVGESASLEENDESKVDYFACKLRICSKDELLARKIPGRAGKQGMDIFGKNIPVENYRDFNFKIKKNVVLSGDGLEIRATCAGTPIRINNYTYLVENAYFVNKNVDLAHGSINFPGDVNVGGDVLDGLHIDSGGKVLVRGTVSGGLIKAEGGLFVGKNVIASEIVVGERHVFRSRFNNNLLEVREDLAVCLSQVEQLQNVSGNLNAGRLLKIVLEKNFQHLPKKIEELDNLLSNKDPEYIKEELEIAVKSIRHFLVGLGPLQLKSLVNLKNAMRIIDFFLQTKGGQIPTHVVCETNYVQNSKIDCAGDFLCTKGIYNSQIRTGGSIKITGVCRGGELHCSGDVSIREMGGSSVSLTILKAGINSELNIEYCHPNVRIFVGKEIIQIDDCVQKMKISREKGQLNIEKLKWNGTFEI